MRKQQLDHTRLRITRKPVRPCSGRSILMRKMTVARLLPRLGFAGLLATIGASQSASAQQPDQPSASGWRSFATVAPFFQGDADLDGGGDFRKTGILFRGGVSTTVGDGHR